MEGKSLWIIKCMPVSARDWLAAKLKVTLVLAIPSILISATLVVIGLHTSLIDTLWAFLIPLAYIFAFGVFGLWLNIRMPRLDWQSEAEAVKQSGSVMVSIFSGMGAAAVPAIVAGVTKSPLVAPITFAVLVGFTIAMWSSLVRSGEKRMLMLH